MPSERKIPPTTRRIKTTAFGALLRIIFIGEFVFAYRPHSQPKVTKFTVNARAQKEGNIEQSTQDQLIRSADRIKPKPDLTTKEQRNEVIFLLWWLRCLVVQMQVISLTAAAGRVRARCGRSGPGSSRRPGPRSQCCR